MDDLENIKTTLARATEQITSTQALQKAVHRETEAMKADVAAMVSKTSEIADKMQSHKNVLLTYVILTAANILVFAGEAVWAIFHH